MLRFRIEKRIAIDRLFGSATFGAFGDWAPVSQMDGIHQDLPDLVRATRFASVKDYGQLKIKALRAKADAALGENFELRRFHNVAIDGGSVPLSVLEANVDTWIAAERKAAKK